MASIGSIRLPHDQVNETGAVAVLDGAVREVGEVGMVPSTRPPHPLPLLPPLPQKYHSRSRGAQIWTVGAGGAP